jgi:asparagine synthase (glutamine-hydrolysing)
MCGFVAVFGAVDEGDCAAAQRAAGLQRHRGPDGQATYYRPGVAVLCHSRLAIMDPAGGAQPMVGPNSCAVVHNGEIYNWRYLRSSLEGAGRRFATASDSEVILHLFQTAGADCVRLLDGDFAFAAVRGRDWMVARDPLGVKPLYTGTDARGRRWFTSELKAILDSCTQFEVFPPGHVYTPAGGLRRYYRPAWQRGGAAYRRDGAGLREGLAAAVRRRLMSDVPLGVLVSGGVDSSLVAALAARQAREAEPHAPLRSFSIGIDPDAPDLRAARQVAAHLGTRHHEVRFDPSEGIAVLGEVIWHLESYDPAEVRGAVPMYLLARAVRAEGVKVVLCGEGADEVFGGYLYFHLARSGEAVQRESVDLLGRLHYNDLERVDKINMAHGVEARVPFLDVAFLDLAMSIDPELKRPRRADGRVAARMEKWLLRAAFDDSADPVLPAGVLWRQKEQADDGVGYGWVDALTAHAERSVSCADLAAAATRFPHDPPRTKEGYLCRALFEEYFPGENAARCVERWVPRWQVNGDSSGRANPFHVQAWDGAPNGCDDVGGDPPRHHARWSLLAHSAAASPVTTAFSSPPAYPTGPPAGSSGPPG